MLAEVRRSDFLPIRSFAAHTAHASDSTFPPVRSSEAPEHLFRLNFRTNAENFSRWSRRMQRLAHGGRDSALAGAAGPAIIRFLAGLEIAGGGSFEQGAVGGESRAV